MNASVGHRTAGSPPRRGPSSGRTLRPCIAVGTPAGTAAELQGCWAAEHRFPPRGDLCMWSSHEAPIEQASSSEGAKSSRVIGASMRPPFSNAPPQIAVGIRTDDSWHDLPCADSALSDTPVQRSAKQAATAKLCTPFVLAVASLEVAAICDRQCGHLLQR